MPDLNANLVKRVQRLPKPARTSDALQPIFEAVSNSIHAIYARWGDQAPFKGKIEVVVHTNRGKSDIWATVEDNGIGLDDENFNAFLTTDTDHKISFGGKGVGRLLWLDCFGSTRIVSRYLQDGKMQERRFTFRLSNTDQITDLVEALAAVLQRAPGLSSRKCATGHIWISSRVEGITSSSTFFPISCQYSSGESHRILRFTAATTAEFTRRTWQNI